MTDIIQLAPTEFDRQKVTATAAAMAAGVALAIWEPSDTGPSVCPTAVCTGFACPGCGMTRATSLLLHGRVGAAMSMHPLVIPIVLQIVIGLALWWSPKEMPRWLLPATLAVNASLLVGVWVFRFATGTLPPV